MLLVISRHGDPIGDEIFNKATSARRVCSKFFFVPRRRAAGIRPTCSRWSERVLGEQLPLWLR